jgi:hypothetical protein
VPDNEPSAEALQEAGRLILYGSMGTNGIDENTVLIAREIDAAYRRGIKEADMRRYEALTQIARFSREKFARDHANRALSPPQEGS